MKMDNPKPAAVAVEEKASERLQHRKRCGVLPNFVGALDLFRHAKKRIVFSQDALEWKSRKK